MNRATAMTTRRILVLGRALAFAAGLIVLGAAVLASDRWTAWEALILGCIVLHAPWLRLDATTGLTGCSIRLRDRDPLAAVPPSLRRVPDDARDGAGRTVTASRVSAIGQR